MHIPDVNVWLALVFEAHMHHRPAVEWFDTLGPKDCAFCRFTQQGFLRLSTNQSVMRDDVVTMTEAWKNYDALLRDDRVFFAEEPAGLEPHWRRRTRGCAYSHRVWGDAYLVAFAEAGGFANVSFDQGFLTYNFNPKHKQRSFGLLTTKNACGNASPSAASRSAAWPSPACSPPKPRRRYRKHSFLPSWRPFGCAQGRP